MPRGFWDEVPTCCVLKVTCGGRLTRGSVVLNRLMRGWIAGTDVSDVLIRVSVGDGLDVMLDVLSLASVENNDFDSKGSHRR